MRAIDTNVVVRYLTGDDPVQAPKARAAVDAGPVFASTTVLLESEWVLRSVYGFAAMVRAGSVLWCRARRRGRGSDVPGPSRVAARADSGDAVKS